ncbi:hypothetical protein AADEFJLK_00207 [Methylovulum psychrotolerans]|uniref:Uncharacterized protein n=2 Tax=Methylovulum psychrotolerans TaxID=1704499 RepID=A0A2S5CQT3_9GAMM|nr:hypothetical protein AADEFJLK_00207 [Methylovulum psychrotolerans]
MLARLKATFTAFSTGVVSQLITDRARVKQGFVSLPGPVQNVTDIVTTGVQYRQGLAAHDDRTVIAGQGIAMKQFGHIR